MGHEVRNVNVDLVWDSGKSGSIKRGQTTDIVLDDDDEFISEIWTTGATRDTFTTKDASYSERFLDRLSQSEILIVVISDIGMFAAFDTTGYRQAITPLTETCI